MSLPEAQPAMKQQEALKQRSDDVTYLNATTSLLLMLPAEIQIEIFDFAISPSTIMLYQEYNHHTDIAKPKHRHAIPLLFVCRQIHSEVAILPYKVNVFLLIVDCYLDLADFLN
ncbi:hypothetical protein J4E85_009183 [Alternaria conjuncta]|uniref:uncharacterized protein n=1 Tax=Alternaria conjuncta TaxID=181017 RepID=UPI00221E5F91|nr:uncharacterized protein J4E85_009183 [Alternaria conjuncta]KAI4920416.1 hypothetical protein J4E85_009183 [Alternaria conjuncta]